MTMNGPAAIDLSAFLAAERVVFIAEGTSKADALDQLCTAVSAAPGVGDPVGFRKAIHQREEVSSTGIGGGIAVPHAKLPDHYRVHDWHWPVPTRHRLPGQR